MKLSFFGASGEVTGSNYLVSTDSGKNILVDCGLFQGYKTAESKNYQLFPYQPAKIDALLLTHAHLDHTGRLPKLAKHGFSGPIFATDPTIELTQIVLEDAVGLIAEESKRDNHQPLYTLPDVEKVVNLFKSVEYHQKTEIDNGVFATYFDAGHILGSASILLEVDGKSILFSGDIGNPPTDILPRFDDRPAADAIVIESTYGGRVHEPAQDRIETLKKTIDEVIRNKGVLLMPVFAIERAQEILYELNKFSNSNTLGQLSIFLDSPMASKATDVFRKYHTWWNKTAQQELVADQDLFSFPSVTFTPDATQSKAILQAPFPKMIIAGSGMMNGGRILHHLQNYVSSPNTVIMIVGFQVAGTLGRRLIDGERDIKIMGKSVRIKSKLVETGAYSGHADQPKLIDWLQSNSNFPNNIYVTHGEPDQASALVDKINSLHSGNISAANYGQTVEI